MSMARRIQQTLAIALLLCMALAGRASAQSGAGFYYSVRKGDSLRGVSGRFGVSYAMVASANRISPNAGLVAGSRLWIPKAVSRPVIASRPAAPRPPPAPAPSRPAQAASAPTGGLYTVQGGDTLSRIATTHGTTPAEIASASGIGMNSTIKVGQRLRLPGGAREQERDIPGGGIEIARSAPTPAPSRPEPEPRPVFSSPPSGGIRPSARGFVWPVEGRVIKRFVDRADEKYTGIDIAVPRGTEVRAARDGKVTYAGDSIPYYGRMVILEHGDNLASCYALNDRLLVREGQQISRGQVIARSGEGRDGEPHIHFEIRRNREAVNPEPYLP